MFNWSSPHTIDQPITRLHLVEGRCEGSTVDVSPMGVLPEEFNL